MVDQGKIGESTWAAEAAECANQQGKFWEYHDLLFSKWRGENVGTFTKANLKQYAASLNLDAATFNSCIDGDKTKSVVDADAAEAARLGVNGTPSFFVNNRTLSLQSLDFAQFQRAFDSQLK